MDRKIRFIGVAGLVSQDMIKSFTAGKNIDIVTIDSGMIFGETHLKSAIEHANRSFKTGTNVANMLSIEIVRYLSGERQISSAMKKMCSKPDRKKHVLLIIGDCDVRQLVKHLGIRESPDLIGSKGKNLKRYGLNDTEISTVPKEKQVDLILEKVAMTDLDK